MKKHSTLLWATALILGWLFDLLFWKQPFGINFAIYSVLCLLGGVAILLINHQYPARATLFLFPLILVFAAITAVRAEPLTIFLGVLFTLLLMLVLANTFLGGRWIWYGLADYLNSGLRLLASMIARPVSLAAEVHQDQAEAGVARRGPKIWPIVRGILIALPIVAIFAALLASADVVFGNGLDSFLKFFAIQNLPQYIFRMAYILIGAYALVGVILHASTQSRDEKLVGEDKPVVPAFLGFVEAIIVLGSVTVLFASFVFVQFRYFFGGQTNITVAGFTYAEYARRGFGELVAVAFFSLLMILSLEAITRREGSLRRGVFSGLSVAIVALVMVMLASAYQRLALYEAAYGFSRLRMYTHVALVWIALLMVAVVALEIMQRQRAFTAAMLIASLGFALSLAAVNVDGLIVRQNVQRALHGQALDVSYLFSLSTDSVPVLVDVFQSPSTPDSVRTSVGVALVCRLNEAEDPLATGWRSFTYSRWRAGTALNLVKPKLQGYRVLDDGWSMHVLAPGGSDIPCHATGGGD